MASFTLRRLTAVCSKTHPFLRGGTTSSSIPAVTSKLSGGLPPNSTPPRLYLGEIAGLRSAASLTTHRGYASAATAAETSSEEARELSPDTERGTKSYKERLVDGVQWIPAHWLTVVYKDMFRSKEAPTPEDALLLLNCFDGRLAEESPPNRVIMAEKAWQDLKEAGTKLDVRHYNALLSVYLANDHAFDPEDFLVILSEDGVAMDNTSYLLFVQRYCQTGNVSDAMRTLEFMKRWVELFSFSLFQLLLLLLLLFSSFAYFFFAFISYLLNFQLWFLVKKIEKVLNLKFVIVT